MSEELVWELFVQAGPVGMYSLLRSLLQPLPIGSDSSAATAVNVYLPKDRVTNMHQQYGFVEYRGEEDADYVSMHPRMRFLTAVACSQQMVQLMATELIHICIHASQQRSETASYTMLSISTAAHHWYLQKFIVSMH